MKSSNTALATKLKTSKQGKYVFIETFGCQMNVNDSERMTDLLKASEYTITSDAANADLILLNTCSVRDKAEQKVYSSAGRYRELKDNKPDLIIGISGCVAQQGGERLLKRMPYVDLIVGTHNVHRIASIVNDISQSGKRTSSTEMSEDLFPDEYDLTPDAYKGKVKAFVNIMRGCNNFCTYCIVPYVRGREVSRTLGDIITEVESLAEGGTKEVTLIGQNVNSYAGEVSFPELLSQVCAVEGIERVRFITSHPKDISEELIYLYAKEEKLVRSLHLPLQSASDKILKLMGRGYSVTSYMAKVELLKKLYPDIALTTDIIVAFPGEEETDFDETIEAIKKIEFEGIFSFKYSVRPGTKAEEFTSQVAPEVARARLATLQELQKKIGKKKSHALVGTTQKVLVEGRSKGNAEELTGRTPANRVVNFAAISSSSGGAQVKAGDITELVITSAYANSLRGYLI
jgi:tRNA-2-methylthio-N6-dimethylallyladenosine synthase